MVYFKDISSSSGVQHLVILDDEKRPKCGPYKQLITVTPTNLAFCRRSARRIIEGKAKWGDAVQFAGEFRYIKEFWEWTEDILNRCEQKLVAAQVYDSVYASLFTYDRNYEVIKAFCEAWCPSTNTLLTSFGELSISLWDLHTLAGLPINGLLYDKVIPCAKSLTVLMRRDEVPTDKWIKFWFKRATKYCEPPPRKEKKAVHPKSTHNPSGTFGVHGKWSSAEEALFSKLGIEGSLKEETFLAAYLACWLYTFALPTDGVGLIRPSTFKVASIMAAGRRVGLAVPVLASIYKEENESSNLDRHWKRPKRDSNISKSMNVDGDSSSHAPSMLNFAKELEDEVLDIEDDEASEDSQESILGSNLLANTLPVGMGSKAKLPQHAAVSVFEGEIFVLNHQKEFLQKMWSDLLVKISKTPVDFISSIQDDVCFVLESMKSFQRFDVSKVKELLNVFFSKAAAYDKARSFLLKSCPRVFSSDS
ncbi:UNVERIFIED_CONTAM: hypothetical protein Slati_0913900 [Sesamum latifolium]|uniref:Aminotransferase-like plant mobile domain-containing protein n=1 Tax=Sesamum latifolium TaxID=2727402 RepID=A0AAW2XS37_9LAMI